jgi:two-component system response regulator FixJ
VSQSCKTKVRYHQLQFNGMLTASIAPPFAALEDDLRTSKPEVILVEDDPSVLRALRRLLEVSGFKVRAFARPSALQAAGIPDPNACLIFDVHLPEMTGADLYRALAASGCRSPLVLITGRVDETTRAMTKRVGAAAVLIKPFSRDSLLTAIREGLASAKNPW